MNAVIALCHFCEAHGPSAVFCTQTIRKVRLDEIRNTPESRNKDCLACNYPLGPLIYSEEGEGGATFVSTQSAVLPEVVSLVKQAAVRSLSCEVNINNDGGFVFFGDSARGHVLGHTFHVSDSQARGYYQLFSIIVLMRDKYFLLNAKPFLAEHIRKISMEIQTNARAISVKEELSSRQQRLSGTPLMMATPRSLVELTGERNIFAILHSHFSWILLAGARFLTEHVTFGNLPWLPPQSSCGPPQQRLTYNSSTLPILQKYEESIDDPEHEELFSLRHIKQIVGSDNFASVCYCAITGTKIIVRGALPELTFNLMICLKKLLPEAMHNLIRIDAQHQHSISSEYKIISLSNDITLPAVLNSIMLIDFSKERTNLIDNSKVVVKWQSSLPDKLPELLVKLLKAVEEKRFSDLVLNKHTRVLIEEWKNKVNCLNQTTNSNPQSKLRKVLGIQTFDQPVVNYWSAHL